MIHVQRLHHVRRQCNQNQHRQQRLDHNSAPRLDTEHSRTFSLCMLFLRIDQRARFVQIHFGANKYDKSAHNIDDKVMSLLLRFLHMLLPVTTSAKRMFSNVREHLWKIKQKHIKTGKLSMACNNALNTFVRIFVLRQMWSFCNAFCLFSVRNSRNVHWANLSVDISVSWSVLHLHFWHRNQDAVPIYSQKGDTLQWLCLNARESHGLTTQEDCMHWELVLRCTLSISRPKRKPWFDSVYLWRILEPAGLLGFVLQPANYLIDCVWNALTQNWPNLPNKPNQITGTKPL